MRPLLLPLYLLWALVACAGTPLCGVAAPGDSCEVSSITLLGLRRTKEWIVLQELPFRRGEALPMALLDDMMERSRNNIYNLGLFTSVSLHPKVVDGKMDLLIQVRERWYVFGSPVLALEERNSYDMLGALGRRDLRRLVYGADVEWRNLTGRNETLRVTGQLGFSRRLLLDFYRPSLLPEKRIDLRLTLRYNYEPEIIIGTVQGIPQWRNLATAPLQRSHEAWLGVKKRFSIYTSLYAELGMKYFRLADSLYAFTLQQESLRYLSNNEGIEYYPSLLLQFTKDRRDLMSFPLEGYKYQVFGRVAGPGSTSFAKAGATFAQYLPLRRRWNFSYGFHYVHSWGKRIPWYEKNVIGLGRREFSGISYELRGYEPYLIDATQIGMAKAEWKFAIVPRQMIHLEGMKFARFQQAQAGVYLTAFGELGYVSDKSISNQDGFLKDRLLGGSGLGLSLLGPYDLLWRVEYSFNHLGRGGVYVHGTLPIR